ncbi:MAG TPA: PilZ domain-containing protein [Myxococcales bacterium]|nr:PilZ domain-containing protein [Myxococcales bacterium]
MSQRTNHGQRSYPRAPLSGSIRFYDWNHPHDALAREIGGGGLFLQTEELVPEGSLLTLRIELPASRSFTVLGRVVRTVRGGWAKLRQSGLAIQFMDLGSSDRQAILDYVARHGIRAA